MRCSIDQCTAFLDMIGGHMGAAILMGVCIVVIIALEKYQADKPNDDRS